MDILVIKGIIVTIIDIYNKTPEELQQVLGQRVRTFRINRNSSQEELAEKAGVSLKTLQNLELGHGSSTETLLRTLKALNSLGTLDLLAAAPSVSPLALLRNPTPPRRVRRPR